MRTITRWAGSNTVFVLSGIQPMIQSSGSKILYPKKAMSYDKPHMDR
jgi:hypothetical protein